MGSGETTPSMVTTHRRVLDRVRTDAGDPRGAVVIDTPYGFQRNADEISARTVDYFSRNVGHAVSVLELRSAESLSDVAHEDAIATVADAAWVFTGPGSPSFLARQWLATRLPATLTARLEREGASVYASAAACTVGARTLPVYDIYKVGADPHWQPGLGLLEGLGLDAVLIPHFDNAEGGTHDTRYCYMGEERLEVLEDQLPSSTWVLGIDEHTALVVDTDTGRASIEGRGGVTVRTRDHAVVFPGGEDLSLEELVRAATGAVDGAAPRGTVLARSDRGRDDADATGPNRPSGSAGSDASADPVERFEHAIDAGDALTAAEVTVALETEVNGEAVGADGALDFSPARRELRRQIVALARLAQTGLHEHRELVAPHVEVLLRLREEARAERRFDVADAIRDTLVSAGIEVRDAAEGSSWEFHDPIELARRG
jgi:cyanophycinase-like exopeptidase